MIWQNVDLFDEFQLPLTLTAFGTKLVKNDWDEKGWEADDILGQEPVKVRKYSPRLGYATKTTEHPFTEAVYFEEGFVTETYHGGRNEQFLFGIADEGKWRDLDLSSAYTTAMSLISLPQWEDMERDPDPATVQPTDLAFFSVDFVFPEAVRFPTLPIRTNNGIIFPLTGHCLCAAPELFLARKLGAELDIKRSIRVPMDATNPVFKDFITSCIKKRSEHTKGSFENLFWKEVGNSTYGKTAQGLREKRVYDLRDDAMVPLPPSQITQPFFASFITSFVRAVLGEILNGFSSDVDVFSVTTDGFLSNASDAELTSATSGPIFKLFADARLALDNSGKPIETKHEIGRPIGWRTRGSATLVPGNGPNGIVLQKGGLKTNEQLSTADENEYVINQFLNRTPESVIQYRSAIGVKDMVRIDSDLLFLNIEKRLSMEFDWKRKPVSERDVEFNHAGTRHKHLSFNTVPHKTHAEFEAYREAWEGFDKKPRRTLKSLRDFRDFETFQVSKSYPDKAITKYLKKKDGDLDRLASDLCCAFVHFQAGFDAIRRNNMTYQQFCNIANDHGIPCSINKLDYAKKRAFSPNTTPRTPAVMKAITSLRDSEFPRLEIDKILVAQDQQNVSPPTQIAAA